MNKPVYVLAIASLVMAGTLLLVNNPGSEPLPPSAASSAHSSKPFAQPVALPADDQPDYVNPDWALDKLWDDGKAEVNVYEATRPIYGQQRSFDYTHVVVKEVFNEEYDVKTDDYGRGDLFEVMKVNKFARIPTENYPYHFMTSVFVLRQQPGAVYKFVNSSQEWCGQTYKQFDAAKRGYDFTYHSYWDGQGSGSHAYRRGFWFEDQLSYTLRALRFADGLTFRRRVLPSQITSKARVDQPVVAEFEVSKVEEGWKVTVDMAGRVNEYWFEEAYPNKLLRQETWDGRRLKLKESRRYAYWRQ